MEDKVKVNGVVNGYQVDRLKKKAKRSVIVDKANPVINRTKSESQVVPPVYKNSRRSRRAYGRGLPKKGGGGGKGTWGKPGSELLEEDVALDSHDPNYDEDSVDVKLKVYDLEKMNESIMKKINSIILEYFDSGDSEDVLMCLDEIDLRNSRHLVVTTVVETAMDHKPSHREMASVMLSDIHSHVLNENDYSTGYDRLLNNLPDLTLDTPDAPNVLGNFIARSIADECIPPKFLGRYKGKAPNDQSVMALNRAETLLSMKHGLVRLDNVWGVGGGCRPVKHLISKISLLLEEYLSSNDREEAQRCLTDLEVPHFHHELVYEAVNMVLDKMNERTSEMMCDLLKFFYDAVIVTPNQMKEGFLRIYEDMPGISIDVPLAYTILEGFVKKCHDKNILPVDVVKKMPSRGRKRFVSEGDGGRVKDHAYF